MMNVKDSDDERMMVSLRRCCVTCGDLSVQILGAIATEESRPSSAAQCVAYVAVIEIPVRQWNDVIANLVENVVSALASEMHREASLEAIGKTADLTY